MSVTNQTSLFSNFKLLFLWSSSTAYYTSISRWGLIWWCKRQLNYRFDYVCAQTSILRMKSWFIFPPKALAFTYCHKSKNDERQLGLETVRFPWNIFSDTHGIPEQTTTSRFPVSTMNSIPAHITGQRCWSQKEKHLHSQNEIHRKREFIFRKYKPIPASCVGVNLQIIWARLLLTAYINSCLQQQHPKHHGPS